MFSFSSASSRLSSSSAALVGVIGAVPLVLLLSASNCSKEGGNEAELTRAFVTSYVEDYLRPTSALFVDATNALEESAQACSGQTQEDFLETGFDSIAFDFERSWLLWGRLSLARFGPYDEEPLRLEPKIGVDVVDRRAVDAAIADAHTPESIREIGANRRGLPAVEYVLYEVMRQEAMEPEAFEHACTYLIASTADVHFLAQQWETGFLDPDNGWANNLTDPGSGDVVEDDIEALTLIIQNIGDALYIAREDGIHAPLGSAPDGALNLDALLARPSGLTLSRIDAAMEAASSLVRANDGEGDRVFVSTLYATRNENAHSEVNVAFDVYWNARGDVGTSFEVILENDLEKATALEDALRGVTTLVLSDVMGGLGLAVSFVDADGD